MSECFFREEQIWNKVFDPDKGDDGAIAVFNVGDLNDFIPTEYKSFDLERDANGLLCDAKFYENDDKTGLIRHITLDRDADGLLIGGSIVV